MNSLKQKVRTQTTTYILAGLGLVAGLAWNEAIKELIDWLFPLDRGSIGAKFIYAIIITLVVVMIGTYLSQSSTKQTD